MHIVTHPNATPTLQALLNEITSYEANIQEVEKATKELVASDHFASDTIEQQNSELQHAWRQLKLLAAKRTQKLSDALEAQKVGVCEMLILMIYDSLSPTLSHPLSLSLFLFHSQYYQDANEADVWMNDKAGIAANQDYGRDEDAAVKALKKHKVICEAWHSSFTIPLS